MGIRVILSALLVVALVPSSSPAQTAHGGHRVEAWADLGVMTAAPVVQFCCELRTPPSVRPAESQTTFLPGVGGRFYETPTTSTAIQINWGAPSDVTGTSFAAFSTPPFTTYTLERSLRTRVFTLSVVQAFDFLATEHVRPYFGGGLLLWRQSSDQHDTQTGISAPGYRLETTESFSFSRLGASANGGLRFYPAPHFLIGTEAGVHFLAGKTGTDPAGVWAIPSSSSLYLRFHIGFAY